MFKQYQHIHFIGAGGSGISALARLALAAGKPVTGSDTGESVFTRDLRKAGALIVIGHRAENLPPAADLVIYTEAIDRLTNPEYLAAVERGLKVMSYFQALGEWSAGKKTIVVTGTHGKTTTTALLGCALIRAGLSPTVIVGSEIPEFGHSNLYIGTSDWFVVEGCEYRRSFLNLHPFGMIILNCEPDHLDYYKDEADYVSAFRELALRVPTDGFIVANATDKNAAALAAESRGRAILVTPETVDRYDFHLRLMGDFNRANAAHACQAAEAVSADPRIAREAMEDFGGAGRRMEVRGTVNGATLIDDYGHHPTEVRATLGAIRQRFPHKKLLCVFQPHQYSRTFQFLDAFAEAFGDADRVIIPTIYAARDTEEDKKKVSAASLVARIAARHPSALWGEGMEKTKELVLREAKPDTVIVVMGAGDISRLVDDLLASNAKLV